jgi:5S rRNA maturation endonuclease (ribonuclease M5)
VRYDPKDFRQRRPDGHSGWIWNLEDTRRIPYRLRELREAVATKKPVIIVEGEKDVDALRAWNLTATTCPGGAGKWRAEYNDHLRDADVIIIPDNDTPGKDHARGIARAIKDIAARIRIIDLATCWPACPEKGDISDWIEAGGTREQLDDWIANAPDADAGLKEESSNKRKQADTLIEIAGVASLFHDRDETCYADIEINGHRETWPIRSKGLKRWLIQKYFENTRTAPNSEAIATALAVIEARAHFDSPARPVYVRTAEHEGRYYIDLCNEGWQAIEIDADGWRVIDRPPVRFRRARGMQALPVPAPDGNIDLLRQFVNVATDEDFVLAVTWTLAALRNRGPFPVLVPMGEQGSGKSTITRILRALVDPNKALLRTQPHDERDLRITANNSWVIAADNVSSLPAWLSDAYCRLATGGGFATRELYTDQDETIFESTRPIILNGIEDFVTRPDLADRAILLTLQPIPEEKRRSEDRLWSDFDCAHPLILGALLDMVAHGLRELPNVKLGVLPRMADFALWGTACETAAWKAGAFLQAYSGNRGQAVLSVVEADPVASGVLSFMKGRKEWNGSASELLPLLAAVATEAITKSKDWPTAPQGLSNRLRRAATNLRKLGVDIAFKRRTHAGTRTIFITVANKAAERSSAASASSVSLFSNDLGLAETGAQTEAASSAGSPSSASSSADKSLKIKTLTMLTLLTLKSLPKAGTHTTSAVPQTAPSGNTLSMASRCGSTRSVSDFGARPGAFCRGSRSRRPAAITQADIARAIRAAKQAGAAEVEVRVGDVVVLIRLQESERPRPLDSEPRVVL